MKTKFKEYYPFDETEYKDLWNNSLFVFDANVILNLYRYSEATKSEFINAIKNVETRIWLPFHVAKEFQKNRLNVISEQGKIYKEFAKTINTLKGELENKNRNPFLSVQLYDKFSETINSVQKELSDKKEKFENLILHDKFHLEITEIFNNKVGNEFSLDELNSIYKEGKQRFLYNIPPGYKDKNKPEPDKYGDLVLWFQIIKKAEKDKTNIIFITDDQKEDWWLEQDGKIISPRPELLKEFREKANRNCYIYKPFQFLKNSNKYLNSNYKDDAIYEIEHFLPKSLKNKSKVSRIIELVIFIENSENELIRFTELVKKAGYQISYTKLTTNEYQLIIVLSNIPDIERRFKEKYLNLLSEYNLKLKDYKMI